MEKNKVLIVDDIPENIETISEMIKDFDIDVKTANGGKEAIELIDSFKPDVILLDLMMPNVNGWDVIDHVRSKYSKNLLAELKKRLKISIFLWRKSCASR